MSLFFVAVSGLCAVALIAFSALIGILLNGFWPDTFSGDFWSALSSLATAGGAIATAFAASVAVSVFKHQKLKEAAQQFEDNSKYYMDQCHEAVERAIEHLIDKKANSESLISASLILAEVTRLEQFITESKHRRLYSIHRQNLINRCEDTLISISEKELSNADVKYKGGYSKPLPLDNYAVGLYVDIQHYYEESLIDGQPFITPFEGVPLGRLLCLYRFFINDPHFNPPSDRLTQRELNELEHLQPIRQIRDYVHTCLTLEHEHGKMKRRDEPVDLGTINMNYDLNITRVYRTQRVQL